MVWRLSEAQSDCIFYTLLCKATIVKMFQPFLLFLLDAPIIRRIRVLENRSPRIFDGLTPGEFLQMGDEVCVAQALQPFLQSGE